MSFRSCIALPKVGAVDPGPQKSCRLRPSARNYDQCLHIGSYFTTKTARWPKKGPPISLRTMKPSNMLRGSIGPMRPVCGATIGWSHDAPLDSRSPVGSSAKLAPLVAGLRFLKYASLSRGRCCHRSNQSWELLSLTSAASASRADCITPLQSPAVDCRN